MGKTILPTSADRQLYVLTVLRNPCSELILPFLTVLILVFVAAGAPTRGYFEAGGGEARCTTMHGVAPSLLTEIVNLPWSEEDQTSNSKSLFE